MSVDRLAAPTNTSISSNIPRVVMNCALLSDYLNICHLNVQSLCARKLSKFNELKEIIVNSKLDIVCISETWLNKSISDEVIAIDGYNIIRNDRTHSQGGGICVYFKNDLRCKAVSRSEFSMEVDNINRVEYLFVEVCYSSEKFLLGIIYNPPRNDCSSVIYDQLLDLYLNYSRTLIVGDFNTDIRTNSSLASNLNSVLEVLGLRCVSFEPTHYYAEGCSLIDLMITSDPDFVLKFNQVSAPGFSRHDIIFGSLNISRNLRVESPKHYRDFNRVDMALLESAVDAIDWSLLYSISDADLALEFLNQRLLELFDLSVPVRISKPRNNPWFNDTILNAMTERNIAYDLWKNTKSAENLNQYRTLRNRVTNLINIAKKNFISNSLNLPSSSKILWKKLKNIGVHSSNIQCNQFNNTVDEINASFGSNFTNDTFSLPVPPLNENGFSFSNVTEAQIYLAMNSIKSDAIGLDNIPLRFLKLIFPLLASKFCYVFNLCINNAKFPKSWKTIKVIPIRKKPRSSEMTNLRPISILCAMSKVFEKLLKQQMLDFIQCYGFLSDYQSGFRPGHNTTTAFLKINDDIHKEVDKKGVALLLLIDFSKAFDRISHNKLLHKLSHKYCFSRSAVSLIQSYLSNRTQCVSIDGIVSQAIHIMSGVPQGSVLGPLLFSLYINDLPSVLRHCQIHMFADDVQLYICSTVLSIRELAQLLNADLERISNWSERNLLPINSDKTKAMYITRSRSIEVLPPIHLGGSTIEYVEKVINLGFVLTNDLEWDNQVNHTCSKIYGRLRQLKMSSSMLRTDVKLKLFKSLILPHFVYGAEFLLNASARSIDRLRVALNSCIRYVYNLSRFSRVSHLQTHLLGCSFAKFIQLRAVLTLYKIVNSISPNYLLQKIQVFHNSRTRSLIIPRHNTSHYGNTMFVRGIAIWNLLPIQIKNNNTFCGFRRDCIAYFNGVNQRN